MKIISVPLILATTLGLAGAQSLRALADSHGIHMGAAVTLPGGTSLAPYESTLTQQFNMVVCENAMKFGNLEATRNVFTFTTADAIFNFATSHGLAVRGHNFCWHSQSGFAQSINVPRDTMLFILKNHINKVMAHYPGIYEWDVVNEGVNDNGASLRASNWQVRIGNDYIDSAFVFAHRADPNALLVYNDYGAEAVNTKSTFIYNMVSGLKTRGIPISGVGLQCHFSLNSFDTASIGANMTRLEALGLNISITELDITTSNTTANLNTQKANYQAMMALCVRHPRCKTFITWGVNDAQSWRGANAVALLFTGTTTITPKPAYDGIVAALSAAADIWQVATGKSGVLRPVGTNNGSALFNVGGKSFDLSGRKLSILPLSK